MTLIDTHSHIYGEEFDADRDEVIARSLEAGVRHIILPDVDRTSREAMMSLAAQYDCCSAMVGLHPTSVNENPAWREELSEIEALLEEDATRYVAVGEIGLDLYWSRDYEQEQREALRFQLDLALKYGLPIDVHVREAWDELLEELAPYADRGLRGVIHAFTGEEHHYHKILEMGDFLFGIGGVVTFKKSKLAAVVAAMDIQHIVFETDAPYLTPAPHRGKRNEPAYIPHIASLVAELVALPLEQVARQTTANAERMFKI